MLSERLKEIVIKFFKDSGRNWQEQKLSNDDIQLHYGFNLTVNEYVDSILQTIREEVVPKEKVNKDFYHIESCY